MAIKLQLELYKLGRLIEGRVTYQDESLRAHGDRVLATSSRGFIIDVSAVPELTKYQLYVRGSIKSHDAKWFSKLFDTDQQANFIYSQIEECLVIINRED